MILERKQYHVENNLQCVDKSIDYSTRIPIGELNPAQCGAAGIIERIDKRV